MFILLEVKSKVKPIVLSLVSLLSLAWISSSEANQYQQGGFVMFNLTANGGTTDAYTFTFNAPSCINLLPDGSNLTQNGQTATIKPGTPLNNINAQFNNWGCGANVSDTANVTIQYTAPSGSTYCTSAQFSLVNGGGAPNLPNSTYYVGIYGMSGADFDIQGTSGSPPWWYGVTYTLKAPLTQPCTTQAVKQGAK